MQLQPLREMYLHSDHIQDFDLSFAQGSGTFNWILFGILLLILSLAFCNYLIIKLALTDKNAERFAIQKYFGSSNRNIFVQVLQEIGIYTVTAFALTVVLTFIFYPYFAQIISPKHPFPFYLSGTEVIGFLLIFLLAAFMAFPLYYTVIQSLKPIEEIFRFPPTLYVSRPVMDNYGEMFRILANMWVPLSRYLFNTLFIAVLGTGLHVLVAGMAAYPLAKHNFPGRNLIFGVIMLGLLFVNQVTFVPSFVIIAKLDILNTYLAYLLPTIGVSLGLFLMRQFISQLPDSMLEAAKIDGANEHRVFFSIVFPSIKPAVITVIIFQFINLWNGLPSDVVYNEELKSLTQAMSQITAANAYARYGPSMAASVIMMIPPIVIFVSLQSKVIETMTSAGIKG